MIALDDENPTEGELRQDLSDFKDLVESRGWLKLMSVVEAQREARGNFVYQPITQEKVLEQEFTKGEMAGIKLFMQMPHDLIESMRNEIEQFNQARENDDAT